MTREIKNRVAVSQPKRNTQETNKPANQKLGQANAVQKKKEGCC